MPRFRNDLLLKLCLHEEDRKQATPTLEALDSRGCFLLVAPRTSCATGFAPTGSKREPEAPANGVVVEFTIFFSVYPFLERQLAVVRGREGNGRYCRCGGECECEGCGDGTVAAAEEAKARAKAAAAEEAVMVAKAIEAGVSIPWAWRESETLATETRPPSQVKVRIATEPRILPFPRGKLKAPPSALVVDMAVEPEPARVPQVEQACQADANAVDVFVWEGSQSSRECQCQCQQRRHLLVINSLVREFWLLLFLFKTVWRRALASLLVCVALLIV